MKRLGWDEENTFVTDTDILDPYDYPDDELEGEVFIITASGPFVTEHTMYLVNGELADPKTIDPDVLIAALDITNKRKFPLSTVDRAVQLDPTPCPECIANHDPNNVPVHPHCNCSVITNSISAPDEVPSHDDMLLLAEALSKVNSADPALVRPDFVLEGRLRPRPESVIAIDESLRFADLLTYIADNEDQLNTASQLVGMLFDNEDLSEETESGTANLVFINDLLEAGTAEDGESFVPNISRASHPKSIILPPNASISELSTAYRLLRKSRNAS